MATVAVTIAGRVFRIACGEGEEAHLQAMARHVDATLAILRTDFGEIGDQRLVVMAAITIADEMSEARERVAVLEAELALLRASGTDGEASRDAMLDDVVAALGAVAERIELVAKDLTGAGWEPGS